MQSAKTKTDNPAPLTASSQGSNAPRPNEERPADNELQDDQQEPSTEELSTAAGSPGLVVNVYVCVTESLITTMPVPSADMASSATDEPLSDGSTLQTVSATGEQSTQLIGVQPNAGPPAPLPAQSEKAGTMPLHQALPAVAAQRLPMAAPGAQQETDSTAVDAGASADGSTDASLSSPNGKPLAQGPATAGPVQSASSNEALLQNLKRFSDPTTPTDSVPIETGGEQRTLSDTGHSDMLHDSSLGTTDDRTGAAQSDVSHGSPSQLHGQSRFGEAMAAQMAEPAATMDGSSSHRSASSSSTGRTAAAPSWSPEPGQVSVIHSVSLDLEPADLGPVNVRIFMMDRIVHAHIRTEHLDLGQGMIGQQQQLETKLQHSGLEMGEFKVTVDQHQLPRHDSQGWLGQPGTWRSAIEASRPRESGRESEVATLERPRRSGIVSFFA